MRLIDEFGVKVESVIQCFEVENISDFGFDKTKKISRLVMNSTTLRSSLENWDVIGTSTRVQMSPEEPKFVIRSEGIVGFVEITFTEELLNHDAPFRCTQLVSHNYQTAFLKT